MCQIAYTQMQAATKAASAKVSSTSRMARRQRDTARGFHSANNGLKAWRDGNGMHDADSM